MFLSLFFSWNLDLFISSLDSLGETSRGSPTIVGKFENSTGFIFELFLSLFDNIFGSMFLFLLNWDEMFYLNK